MRETVEQALDVLAEERGRWADHWRFEWARPVREAINRLRLGAEGERLPVIAAVVGGASSGKSTVFNNLLGGHLASRITARGHATLGPVLAVHEDHRDIFEPLLSQDRMLPGLTPTFIELDENSSGSPDSVATLFHVIDPLRNVALLDTPDFTTDAARKEGDIALSLLPWFDRLIVVVDHERWFDRQSISMLRAESVRFGQERLALFNRTRETALADVDREALGQQAARLSADRMLMLEFRRGRGLCLFAPGTLDEVYSFLAAPKPAREGVLLSRVAESANRVLNQNEERAGRLEQLRTSLHAAVDRTIPSTWDCMTSLMTPDERRALEFVSRVLRIHQTREWVNAQTRRVQTALRGLPLIGSMVPGKRGQSEGKSDEPTDRPGLAAACFEDVARRQVHQVRRVIAASTFWSELRRWTSSEPKQRAFQWTDLQRHEVLAAAGEFDRAFTCWTQKVETECRGASPRVLGAVGGGALTLAVVLIAVPGPLSALTLFSAQGAIGASLAKLLAASGAGALLGKHAGRFTAVVHEKLIGTPEFHAVQAAAEGFRGLLVSSGQLLVDDGVAEASTLTMQPDEPVAKALETLRDHQEEKG